MVIKARKHRAAASACPLTGCMAFLGGVWTPNLIQYLSREPRRFGELRADLGRITAKVLTTRLRELERKGVVTRTVLPTSPPSVEYSLTELGRELIPAVQAIVKVGQKLNRKA